MANHHYHPDHRHRPAEKHSDPQADAADTAKHLLDDTQGKWLNNGTTTGLDKLVKDGILPEGSKVIDFAKVAGGLKDDQAKLDKLNGVAPPDTTKATAELGDAQKTQADAGTKLDGAQKAVDVDQNRIDGRTHADEQAQKDLDTVKKSLKKDFAYKSDLETLAKDPKASDEDRQAAQRLLDTFHQIGTGRSSTNRSDYSKTGFGGEYIDQNSLDAGKEIHNGQSDLDRKDMAPKAAARDQAKTEKDAADAVVGQKTTALDDLNKQGADQKATKNSLQARIDEEKQALAPSTDLGDRGKVISGGGYYQVAAKLLGMDAKNFKPTTEQAKELKMLTGLLQDEAKALNNGQLPKYLKTGDTLLDPAHLAEVFDKLQKIANPEKTS